MLRVSRETIWAGHRAPRAFTLIEVMVALLIFFMAVFTILGLLSNTLRNARALQRKHVDAGMVAAQYIFENGYTNQVPEGENSGDFGDLGDLYPDHEWTTVTTPVATNGLYQIDIVVLRRQGGTIESRMAILMFGHNSPNSSLNRGLP